MKKGILICAVVACLQGMAWGQTDSVPTAGVAVQAKSFLDSIMVRWAPTSPQAWELGMEYGYRVERYTVEYGSRIVNVLGSDGLTNQAFKVQPQSEWVTLAQTSKQGAIAAQAIFGESFSIGLSGEEDTPNLFSVYQKVQEQELRFSFHLLAADLEPEVAKLSGLMLVDRQVYPRERYLYRIISQVPPEVAEPDTALVLIGPPDTTALPQGPETWADQKGGSVTIHWEGSLYEDIYLGYYLERSADSLHWTSLNEDPFIRLRNPEAQDSPYQPYAQRDSVGPTPQRWWYRVRGRTVFGEVGPPSDPVPVDVAPELITRIPVVQAVSSDNLTVDLSWWYEDVQPELSVSVERASNNKGPYQPLASALTTEQTTFTDPTPQATNYYRVVLTDAYGGQWTSAAAFAQLIDSVPPVPPTGLRGTIDPEGKVQLSWAPNPDPDIRGYRVFRANYRSEEFFQVTGDPLEGTEFEDQINVQTLTEQVHYQVMALDLRGNQSSLSEVLTLDRPDRIAPKPPVLREYQADAEAITLVWYPSPSTDVQEVIVLRQLAGEPLWRPIASVLPTDTAYTDRVVEPGKEYRYALEAIDESNNRSERGQELRVQTRRAPKGQAPELYTDVDREGRRIRLGWTPPQEALEAVRIYRASGEGAPLIELTTLRGQQVGYTDRRLRLNTQYTYAIQWIYADGSRSEFSTLQTVTY